MDRRFGGRMVFSRGPWPGFAGAVYEDVNKLESSNIPLLEEEGNMLAGQFIHSFYDGPFFVDSRKNGSILRSQLVLFRVTFDGERDQAIQQLGIRNSGRFPQF